MPAVSLLLCDNGNVALRYIIWWVKVPPYHHSVLFNSRRVALSCRFGRHRKKAFLHYCWFYERVGFITGLEGGSGFESAPRRLGHAVFKPAHLLYKHVFAAKQKLRARAF